MLTVAWAFSESIKQQWSQILITNIITKNLKYVRISKSDTDMQWTNAVGKIMMIDLTQCCYKASICKTNNNKKNPTTSGKHTEGMPVWLIQLTT